MARLDPRPQPSASETLDRVTIHVHVLDEQLRLVTELDDLAHLEHGALNTGIHAANVELVSSPSPLNGVVCRNGDPLANCPTRFFNLGSGSGPRRYAFRVRRGDVNANDAIITISTKATVTRLREDPARPGVIRGRPKSRELVCTLAVKPCLKVLVLPADITAVSPHLRLDREVRAIRNCLESGPYAERMFCYHEQAVRVEEVRTHLLTYRPKLVHFCGHGSTKGRIVFTDENDKPVEMHEAILSDLFRITLGATRCIVLNCCYSYKQAKKLVEHVDCAIGIPGSMSDSLAIAFAEGFYKAIAMDTSVQVAFEMGCNLATQRKGGLPLSPSPKIICRSGVNPAQLRLFDAT